jgi:hypothetical protein
MRLRIALLLVPAVVFGVLFALDAAYGWRGSLEMFPTGEQQDKVRVVTVAIGAVVLMLEAATLLALVRQWRGGKASGLTPLPQENHRP